MSSSDRTPHADAVGHPHPTGKPPELRTRLENRFWEKVDIQGPDECWKWDTPARSGEYAAFWLGENQQAHRVAFILSTDGYETLDDIPDGKVVKHVCDNKLCCNPEHLSLGTQSENLQEWVTRTRTPTDFSDDDVREIRRLYAETDMTHQDIADVYGVSRPTVTRIVNRVTFSHVE